MIFRMIGLMALAAALASAQAQAGDIYRWTDEQGRVNYGDAVPDRYKRTAKRVEIGVAAVEPQVAAPAVNDKPQAAPPSATGAGRPAGKAGAAGN